MMRKQPKNGRQVGASLRLKQSQEEPFMRLSLAFIRTTFFGPLVQSGSEFDYLIIVRRFTFGKKTAYCSDLFRKMA